MNPLLNRKQALEAKQSIRDGKRTTSGSRRRHDSASGFVCALNRRGSWPEMASTYALPVASMPHAHSHIHSHSHSHSPSLPSMPGPGVQRPSQSPRAVRQERSNGDLHSHTRSEILHDHGHNQTHEQPHEQSEANTHTGRRHYSNDMMSGNGYSEKQFLGVSPLRAQPNGYTRASQLEPYIEEVYSQSHKSEQDHSHNHSHHGHKDHESHEQRHHHSQHGTSNGHAGHEHSKVPIEKRSGFTNLLLPHVERWPLLHSIMKEKDSRRIFYFMRFVRTTWILSTLLIP